ncbi:MAG TPA: neutral zinc metallopeptidase, partial [Gemmatimonadales bacterium]|nr:neutral zinc metallopeptidase [Gemmatimonadales bacterium]
RDIEDRRGAGGGFGGFGGGGLRIGGGAGLILLLLSLFFGRNLLPGGGTDTGAVPYDESGQPAAGTGGPVASTPEEDREVQFVSFVLDDVQATWDRIFQDMGRQYSHSKLVLFRDYTQSGCGGAETATGPFYCPADGKVYIDLGFYDELSRRFGAPGDFAQAYVLAHEIGHRVQDLLGTEARVRAQMERNPDEANAYSVRLELQADCYAGIWGHSTAQRQILEQGDVEEGLQAAAAVGDDRLQRMGGGRVHPESFTHGTSAQRVGWFKRGLQTGRLDACDTFAQSIGG